MDAWIRHKTALDDEEWEEGPFLSGPWRSETLAVYTLWVWSYSQNNDACVVMLLMGPRRKRELVPRWRPNWKTRCPNSCPNSRPNSRPKSQSSVNCIQKSAKERTVPGNVSTICWTGLKQFWAHKLLILGKQAFYFGQTSFLILDKPGFNLGHTSLSLGQMGLSAP